MRWIDKLQVPASALTCCPQTSRPSLLPGVSFFDISKMTPCVPMPTAPPRISSSNHTAANRKNVETHCAALGAFNVVVGAAAMKAAVVLITDVHDTQSHAVLSNTSIVSLLACTMVFAAAWAGSSPRLSAVVRGRTGIARAKPHKPLREFAASWPCLAALRQPPRACGLLKHFQTQNFCIIRAVRLGPPELRPSLPHYATDHGMAPLDDLTLLTKSIPQLSAKCIRGVMAMLLRHVR
jgi:hypothetical protein